MNSRAAVVHGECVERGGREAAFRSARARRPCSRRLPLLIPRREVVKGLSGVSVA